MKKEFIEPELEIIIGEIDEAVDAIIKSIDLLIQNEYYPADARETALQYIKEYVTKTAEVKK